MHGNIPDALARRFKSPRARPVLIEEYHPDQGWLPPKQRAVVTTELTEALHGRGVTLLRAKWRFEVHEVPLRELHPEGSRSHPSAPPVGPETPQAAAPQENLPPNAS
jgi:hypothetical protein